MISSAVSFPFQQLDMMAEPDFCRDILETRIKCILRDFLKISREISFFQVQTVLQMHSQRLPQDLQRHLLPGTDCLSNASSKTSSRSPERSFLQVSTVLQMNPKTLPQDLQRDLFLPGTVCLANVSSETSSRSPEISLYSRYRL
jgi:hypothetical protein